VSIASHNGTASSTTTTAATTSSARAPSYVFLIKLHIYT